MRKHIFLFFALAGLIFVSSCEKDETRAILSDNPVAPVWSNTAGLTNGGTVILDDANAAETLSFTFSAADFGFQSATVYALVIDFTAETGSLATAASLATSETTTLNTTIDALNSIVLARQVDPTSPAPMNIALAVRATVNNVPDTVYTELIKLTVTPYYVPIVYPLIYVPGSHQGWTPALAPTLRSLASNNIYEGYVRFPDPTTTFKFTSKPNWDGPNYGTSGVAGELSTTGGDISMTGAGTYFFKVNLNNLVWSYAPYNIGVVGDATPNGWSTPDSKMTYVMSEMAATKDYWSITLDLKVGEIKFRLNDDWGWNLGDGDAEKNIPPDGILDNGGDNIPVTVAGNYTIKLYIADTTMYCTIVKN